MERSKSKEDTDTQDTCKNIKFTLFYRSPTGILQEYNESLSEAQLILLTLSEAKYSDEAIKFLAKFYKYDKKGKSLEGIFIITSGHIIYSKDIEKIIFKCKLRDLRKVETHTEGMDTKTGNSIHHLFVRTRKKKQRTFHSDVHSDIMKAANILRS